MKSLKHTIQESLRIGIDDSPEMLQPKSLYELKQIIEKRFEELGPGTVEEPINFNDIDVSEMTTFYSFEGIFELTKFEYIDVSDWDVSNVTNMRTTFFRCPELKSVGDLSNWDVSNVKNIESMFSNCPKLESIGDISNWNVSNIENMDYMFFICKKLESVGDLSIWDVSNVRSMESMFGGCEKLKSIGDISNWDVSNVRGMWHMFYNSGITNIPNWYKI